MGYAMKMLMDRFWSKVDIRGLDECWPWLVGTDHKGYGRFKEGGKTKRAHQVAMHLSGKPVPIGMIGCHSCDNPPCCNPGHLFAGTHKTNAEDRDTKGRQASRVGQLNGMSKLDDDKVKAIRARYAPYSRSHGTAAIARDYGVAQGVVSSIVLGNAWKHVASECNQLH